MATSSETSTVGRSGSELAISTTPSSLGVRGASATSTSASSPGPSRSGGAWTIASPLVMTVLLLKVSGVALLERGLTSTKPGYADYIARTSAFVPWFPRRVARRAA